MADITAPEYISPYVVTTSGGLVLDRDVYTMPVGAASILQNFEPSVQGGYRRLSGTTKYTSSQVGGSSNTILGVAIFNNGVVAAQSTNVYFGTGSTWSSIDSGRTSAGRYRFEKYNFSTNEERLIFADGANAASVYNGTTVMDIKGATTISTTGSASSSSTSLTGLASTAGIMEGMYIGGTNIGSGAKVSAISGTTVTMSVATTGTISGGTVTFAGLGTAPSDPSMVVAFKNHMFYAGMSTEPNTIIFSAIGDENDFTAANGAGSLNVDSTIIALKSFRGELIIFCEDRIYKLAGASRSDFAIAPISRNVGCSDAFSIQEIGGDVIFLAPDGLRTIAGTARIGDVELGTVSKQIQARIGDIGFTNISSVVIRDKSQYRLFYPSGGVESTAKGIIGVLKSNPSGQIGWEYSDIRGIKPACCDSGFISGAEKIIHGGFDGYVYLQESGNSFDGTAMKAVYRSPDLTMGDAGIRKNMQRINVNYDPEGSVNASLFVKYDFEDTGTPQPSAYTLTTADTAAVYDDSGSLYGSAVYDAEGMPIVRQSVEGSGFTVVVRLEDESTNPPITLKGFELEFTPGARM
jgi:hypothetical protein